MNKYIALENAQDFIDTEIKQNIADFDLNKPLKTCFSDEVLQADPNFEILKNELGIVKYECNINGVLGRVTDGKSIMNRGYAIIVASNKQECLANADALIKKFKKDTK